MAQPDVSASERKRLSPASPDDPSAPLVAEPVPPDRKLSRRRRLSRDKLLLAIGLPGAFFMVLFQWVPLAGNVIAFQDYQPFLGLGDQSWVGLENFAFLWNDSFLNALQNTLILTFIQSVLVFPVPLVLALVLNSLAGERLKRTLQSILYLPYFLSWVIVVALFQQMLGNAGMMNTFLIQNDFQVIQIIGDPELFRALLTSQVIWKNAGWGTIIFLAAISKIDQEQYEAAAVDGAGPWHRLWHITLPALKGLFILLFILQLGESLTVGFEQIILQQGPVGRQASEVIDTWVYNNGIIAGDWGLAAAAGLFKSVIAVCLVIGANKLAHMFGERGVYEK